MRDSGAGLGGEVRGTSGFLRRWGAALDDSERAAFVLHLPTGDVRYANRAARARFGDVPGLDALVPTPDTRARLRDDVSGGLPWEGELREGVRASAMPIRGADGGAEGVFVEVGGPAAGGIVAVAERLEAAELEVRRLRRAARWRDAEHTVAMAVGQGRPLADVARVALEQLARLLPVREARVSLVEVDTLRVLVGLRDGAVLPAEPRVLLGATPAGTARVRRAPVQRAVADAVGEFPALRALELDGIRAVLYAPLQVAEAVFGFVELHGHERDVFTPEEVELTAVLAGMVATAMVRERVLEQASRHAQAMEMRAALGREELDRTQEQLIQAAKLSSIGELAAGLVHELNQPLNVLGGYVELLREGSLGEKARDRALDVMARAVERMTSMVDNLRTFARGGGPTVTVVDVATVVNMARELTVGALKRGVRVDCDPGLTVLGDANRLEQVFINLLANALQCEGDPVTVTAREVDDERVAIEVADRGPGVPEPLRQRIFEPFFTTKPPGQGTGLGLSVSARIIQDHGGRIEVEDNRGGGAVFRVVLPRHQPRGAEAVS